MTAPVTAVRRHWSPLVSAVAVALSSYSSNSGHINRQLTRQYPDGEIIASLPGLSTVLGACILAEIGDVRTRFINACGLKAFTGTHPLREAAA